MNNNLKITRVRFTLFSLLLALLSVGHLHAAEAVSFLANVDPDSDQTVLTVQLGDQQIPTSELNDMLRPGGGSVLRITSVHGFLTGTPQVPSTSDYAVIFVGAIMRGGIRGFGAGTLSLNGAGTTQINFDPGLVASLLNNEYLVIRSQSQSNHEARVEVHGFLEDAN